MPSSFMVVRIELIGLKIQDGNPRGFDKPNHSGDCRANIDHASTTAKNAANIMASVIQYKAGFFSTDSSVVISITPVSSIMESEHFDNSGSFKSTSCIAAQLQRRDGLIQHQARHGKCLATFIVEKCVDIGDKVPDSRIERQAFT